ncbi:large ribosomal subunit protein bL34m [Chanos chanos]|uniref:Large ribosomal subunit protein bL34m n=1 Tax=Chanos chanos TaxID=29144 RepID=A0A6J2VI23_CHACN|nr:39S ribosomal protein L34, mitochondrial [Chanos chanos]
MNTIKYIIPHLLGTRSQCWGHVTQHLISKGNQTRAISSSALSAFNAGHLTLRHGTLTTSAEGLGIFQQLPWHYQQVRTGKRGTEYQPSNIKRKRTHGWIKRISTRGGIEVILRRMLKGRKSLTH